MIILDTNVVSELMRGEADGNASKRWRGFVNNRDELVQQGKMRLAIATCPQPASSSIGYIILQKPAI